MVAWGWLAIELGIDYLSHKKVQEYIRLRLVAFPLVIVENLKVDKNSPTENQVGKFNKLMLNCAYPQLREEIWWEVHDEDISRKELSKYIDKLKRAELGLSEEFKEKINCPFCGSKVYDNRDTKFNDSAPDFVCSNNNKDKCSGHPGKFKKGWWVDSKDIPNEWYIKY